MVTSMAGDSCGLFPRLHVLKIDPVLCVDTVDRLWSRLSTTVASTGSGEQAPEVVQEMPPVLTCATSFWFAGRAHVIDDLCRKLKVAVDETS